MLRLHYAPRTISVAVAIAFEEVGTPYEAVRLDFAAGEQTKEDYRRINPKGRVPALETPDGILTETGAVLEYVAPSLVPADPYAAAKMRELMCYLNGTMHPHHAHGLRGERWADQESSFADMKQKVPERMADCCVYLEEHLPEMPFPIGDLQVVSDAYLYVVLTWLKGDGVDIEDHPLLAQFQHKMNTHRSVQAVYEKGML
ncbi:glutathione S-transferase family protein [Cognatiyoonia sp. IB215182]|uniref:glutathione S-transferase family protein n=1 Tax=Cognatiyoonia sp. IB215182 TaxID=3097353 RepID=UPI002A13DA97|nr:glutathione S-transferase family protein [Cognatiyoonia sp. IB215182]MDX8354543.1 glutathione S-transferase family protein [Cognatiyoonia sp. IB215182]